MTKRFGGLIALSDFELSAQEGEILGMIGPNGSGKTTTFNVITGFLKPDSGKVIFEGKDVTGLQPYAIAKLGVIRTFQLANLFFNLTVLDNIMIGFHNLYEMKILSELLNTRFSRNREENLLGRAMEILHITELDSHKNKLAQNLSAGWRKTLAIAVALAANPKLLLLDEPVCTLSPARVASIMKLILRLRDSGITVILIEHNMKAIMDYCDRIAVLNFGRKIAEGTPEQVKQNRDVIDAYLGM